jgi:hypothetical protein
VNPLAKIANHLRLGSIPVVDAVSRARHELLPVVHEHATRAHNAMTSRIREFRSMFAFGALAGSLWPSLALADVPGRVLGNASRAIEPVRLTVGDNWRRVTGVTVAALAGFERVKNLQAAAARQLDSADYALTQLLNDLRPAMALPADVSGLRAVLAEAERTAPERFRKAMAA